MVCHHHHGHNRRIKLQFSKTWLAHKVAAIWRRDLCIAHELSRSRKTVRRRSLAVIAKTRRIPPFPSCCRHSLESWVRSCICVCVCVSVCQRRIVVQQKLMSNGVPTEINHWNVYQVVYKYIPYMYIYIGANLVSADFKQIADKIRSSTKQRSRCAFAVIAIFCADAYSCCWAAALSSSRCMEYNHTDDGPWPGQHSQSIAFGVCYSNYHKLWMALIFNSRAMRTMTRTKFIG